MKMRSKLVTSTAVALFGVATLTATTRAEDHFLRLRTDLGLSQSAMESKTAKRHLDTVICILDRLGADYEILQSPAKRNKALTASNDVDGFFLHSPGEISEQVAVATRPIAIERWFFYKLKNSPDTTTSKRLLTGAVLGTNEHNWLRANGFGNIIAAPSDQSVVKMLYRDRVHKVLMDENLFQQVLIENKFDDKSYSAQFVRYAPLVLYFSNRYVETHPDILKKFNANIDPCVTELMSPSDNETLLLRAHKQQILEAEGVYANLQNLVRQQPELHSDLKAAADIDRRWIEAVKSGTDTTIIREILQNNLSAFLTELANTSNAQITEIFVTSKNGYIIGMNQPTSDYQQSDEAPYQAIIQNAKPNHISKIDFDASTEKFQIQVSSPILSEDKNEILGVLTIGFDADLALRDTPN